MERTIERFGGIDFEKPRFNVRANVNTSQAVAFGARFSMGDQIRFTDDPFLGDQVQWGLNATLRPISRLTSDLSFDSSRLTDPRNGDEEVFNVKIFRAQSTFQFTDRLQIRNITEYNTFDETFDLNVLFTYRVNANRPVHGLRRPLPAGGSHQGRYRRRRHRRAALLRERPPAGRTGRSLRRSSTCSGSEDWHAVS